MIDEKRRILFDTDILIGYFRKRPEIKDIIDKVKRSEIEAFISVITEAEIYSGSLKDDDDLRIEALLSYFHRIPVDSGIAKRAGKLRAKYFKKYRLRTPDALIAASAEKMSLVLMTKNLKHFEFIEEIQLAK